MGYASSDQVLEWLGVTDSKLEDLAQQAADATSDWIDAHCRRTFSLDDNPTARYFDASTIDGVLVTDDIGDNTTVAVATDNAQDGTYSTTWLTSDFQVLPLTPTQGRPWWQIVAVGQQTFPLRLPATRRSGLVQVTARWGWPVATPNPVVQACIMQAARIVKRRTSPEGVAGFVDMGLTHIQALDHDVANLLDPYVLVRVG